MKQFQKIKLPKIKKNKFDLSHEHKLSMNMGDLIPFLTAEVLPGESFKVKTDILARMTPLIAPMMHMVDITTHYWYVPNRILYEDWEDFITGGQDGKAIPVPPQFELNDETAELFVQGSLADYMGIPDISASITPEMYEPINALPFRAYNKIYNENYRDQNLIDEVNVPLEGGIEGVRQQIENQVKIRKRSWEKDYLTSSLPTAQRGDSAVIPIGSPEYRDVSIVQDSTTGGAYPNAQLASQASGGLVDETSGDTLRLDNIESIGATDIVDLRTAFRLQEWLELSMRAGARLREHIEAFFGVKSSDARLQYAEYLGGGKQPMVVSEVLNQAGDQEGATLDPVGTMSGHGISVSGLNSFKKRFEEHGFVIGIISILPKTAYQQNLPKMWSRADKFDYFWQQFAHIGEQPVLNKEAFFNGRPENSPNGIFGYQERYSEYKYLQSNVSGDFKGNLSYWHMGRIFNGEPSLNNQFVESDPTTRIFAVEDGTDQIYVQIYNRISALRPIPQYSIPHI